MTRLLVAQSLALTATGSHLAYRTAICIHLAAWLMFGIYMNRKAIFDCVRMILDRGFRDSEIAALDRAIDEAEGVIVVTAPRAPRAPRQITALIDVSVLKAAAPEKTEAELAQWVDPIRNVCAKYEINTVRRIAAFVTTLAHEGGFKVGRRENMNYSAKRMAEVWPSRFADKWKMPNALAKSLDRKPEEIANHVYANRMGNGAPESGDGWRYRGNGPIQLTGKDNHKAFAMEIGKAVEAASDYIATLEGGVEAAAWFWEENDVNRLADTPGVADETRRINGGTVGIADRTERFNRTVARLLELDR